MWESRWITAAMYRPHQPESWLSVRAKPELYHHAGDPKGKTLRPDYLGSSFSSATYTLSDQGQVNSSSLCLGFLVYKLMINNSTYLMELSEKIFVKCCLQWWLALNKRYPSLLNKIINNWELQNMAKRKSWKSTVWGKFGLTIFLTTVVLRITLLPTSTL